MKESSRCCSHLMQYVYSTSSACWTTVLLFSRAIVLLLAVGMHPMAVEVPCRTVEVQHYMYMCRFAQVCTIHYKFTKLCKATHVHAMLHLHSPTWHLNSHGVQTHLNSSAIAC